MNIHNQFLVTTPSGEQVLVDLWPEDDCFQISWRPEPGTSVTWTPLSMAGGKGEYIQFADDSEVRRVEA